MRVNLWSVYTRFKETEFLFIIDQEKNAFVAPSVHGALDRVLDRLISWAGTDSLRSQ